MLQVESAFKVNIFELYPELALSPVGQLESDAAWVCVLYVHPRTALSQVPFDEKAQILAADYLPGFSPEVEPYASVIAYMMEHKLFLTKKEKFLIEWEMKLEERARFIASLKYNAETYELLDKMMGSSSKMWEQYLKCLKDVEAEQAQTLGGAQESATEKGLI